MSNYLFTEVSSPLDQFEIRDLITINAPILYNINFSFTNMLIYLAIAYYISIVNLNLLSNTVKVIYNSWTLVKETIYDTIYNIVQSQTDIKKGQIYFAFMYNICWYKIY